MGALLGKVGLRIALATGLVLLVFGVVAVARLTGGGSRPPILPAAPEPTSTVDPTAGDDAEVAPTPSAFADDADVVALAKTFTAAWLRRELSSTAWQAGVAKLSTTNLAASLVGVDPLSVPATRATAEPRIVRRTDRFAQVSISVDTGTLILTLTRPENRWLVDGIDWDRA